jgi:fumarylacetoacetase
MTIRPDETHDAALTSWIESANDPASDFPIQNLPLGVYRKDEGAPRAGIAIGDQILDLIQARDAGVLRGDAAGAATCCDSGSLNALMARGPESWKALRRAVSAALRSDAGKDLRALAEKALIAGKEVQVVLPATIGDYTDFYASIHHATNVGRLFRPDNPLLPNYKHVPIGYHGRASSLMASGAAVTRPRGQVRQGEADPEYVPTRRLDYECEVGAFVGPGNSLGGTIRIADAERHLFGLCLVNDWSARDIQSWEYQPLGPFLAKSFATTLSPWVVTIDALAPFRVPATARPDGDPRPLAYLDDPMNRDSGGFDITLEVLITTPAMRESGAQPHLVSKSNFSGMYWTFAQMVTHHASNGCNLRPGDLLASGTVSGPSESARGCLLEITEGGRKPLSLPGGETRTFLEDGDEVILRGYCERNGWRRIGFGECRGTVAAAPDQGEAEQE